MSTSVETTTLQALKAAHFALARLSSYLYAKEGNSASYRDAARSVDESRAALQAAAMTIPVSDINTEGLMPGDIVELRDGRAAKVVCNDNTGDKKLLLSNGHFYYTNGRSVMTREEPSDIVKIILSLRNSL